MKNKLYMMQLILGVILIIIGIYFCSESLNNVVGTIFAWAIAMRLFIAFIQLMKNKKSSTEALIQIFVDLVTFVVLIIFGYGTYGHGVVNAPTNEWLTLPKLLGYWMVCTFVEIIIILIKSAKTMTSDKRSYLIVVMILFLLLSFFLIFGQMIGMTWLDKNFLSILCGILLILTGVLFILNLMKLTFAKRKSSGEVNKK